MEDVAQLFLGTRLQCAQCHHHPYEKWSQRDYFALAAYFSQVIRKPSGIVAEDLVVRRRGEAQMLNKKTKEQVKPQPLGEKAPALSASDDPRQALAAWMVNERNPFFAKTLVNRYWKHFFGRGLVDPEDDMRETNPPSHPELLAALAQHFQDSGFDLKELVRTICRSQTYQLSSLPNEYNSKDKQSFSRFYPRRLSAEVLFDSISAVTASETRFDGLPAGTHAVQLPDNSFNANYYFLTVFGRPDASTSCECERSSDSSLAQCLHLLNSKTIQEKLSAPKGRAETLAKDSGRSEEAKLRELYRSALSRDPDQSEIAAAHDYLDRTLSKVRGKNVKEEGVVAETAGAYQDLVWAVLNTKEFLFNH